MFARLTDRARPEVEPPDVLEDATILTESISAFSSARRCSRNSVETPDKIRVMALSGTGGVGTGPPVYIVSSFLATGVSLGGLDSVLGGVVGTVSGVPSKKEEKKSFTPCKAEEVNTRAVF